jgi:type 1 glutamine amidotransferase
VVSATAGFAHDSIPVAREVIDRLGREGGGFETTHLPDTASLSRLTAGALAAHQAVFFLNTSGELPLDRDQRQALLGYVSGGGGFLGAHAASDTLYAWPEYGDLVGAYFREHPWTQPVTVAVADESHPLTEGLGAAFALTEEVYTFRTSPRAPARVLLRLDPASVGTSGDFPLSWCAPYGAGRSFYTALGHFDAVWRDARVRRHLLAAIRWATGQLAVEPSLTRSA